MPKIEESQNAKQKSLVDPEQPQNPVDPNNNNTVQFEKGKFTIPRKCES